MDPARPLSQQIAPPDDDVAAQLAALSERLDRLVAAQGLSDEPEPLEPTEPATPQAQELRFAQDLAGALHTAQSTWHSFSS